MSLIDDLRKLGAAFPPSHVPSPGELPGVVGALVTLIEHGPELLNHIESDYETVAKFVSGVADEIVPDAPAVPAPDAPAPAATVAPAPAATDAPASTGPSAEEFAAMQEQVRQLLAANQDLQAQVTASAAASRTTAGVTSTDPVTSSPVTPGVQGGSGSAG